MKVAQITIRCAFGTKTDSGEQAKSEYLFCRANGEPIRPDTLTRGFQRTLAKYGIPKMRFHDLRHSCASLLFDNGTSIEDIRQYLRHADIETTMNIYTHYRQSRKALTCKAISEIIRL